jgi:hypothetical protein
MSQAVGDVLILRAENVISFGVAYVGNSFLVAFFVLGVGAEPEVSAIVGT